MNKSSKLEIIPMSTVIEDAQETIQAYMDGTVPVMRTRWSKVNTMLLGGFQFEMVVILAGASGHGKSMFLNNLLRDFTSPMYNNLKTPVKILHFSFEMSAKMELMRRLSSLAEVPLDKMLKADEALNDSQKAMIHDRLKQINEPSIFFVENPGTRIDIALTVKHFVETNPGCKYIVCLDHTLLISQMPGESEIQTLAEFGKLCIQLRKRFGVLVILISQLNDKIESEKRRDPDAPHLHYPLKTDIHGSKQLYHSADIVLVLNQPEQLGLETYGRKNIPTKDLVALHCLKNRHGKAGLTLLKNNLRHGTFDDWDGDVNSVRRINPYGL